MRRLIVFDGFKKAAKNTQSYLNELYTTEKDSNYRYVLAPLIGKKVRIESLEFEISEDSNTTEDNVEHKYKKILVKNGQITRINPYNDEVLPIVLEHIWFMVGDDFEPAESATKIVINGTVNEYMKTNGSKNVGVDVATVSMSAGNNIVIPSSYKQTEDAEEEKTEEPFEYDVPKIFKNLPTLNEDECRVMKAINFYGIGNNKYSRETIKHFPALMVIGATGSLVVNVVEKGQFAISLQWVGAALLYTALLMRNIQ